MKSREANIIFAEVRLSAQRGAWMVCGGCASGRRRESHTEVTVTRGVATQGRVGANSDRQAAGKVSVSGSLTSLDIDGALVEKLLGGTPADSADEALHASADLSGGGDEEVVDVGNLWKSLNTRASVIATTMVGKGITLEGQTLSYFILTALPYESAAIKKMLSGIIGQYDGVDDEGIPVFVPIGKKLSNPEIFPLSS